MAGESPGHSPEATPQVLFLGDSLTAGFGLSREEAFPALLQNELAERGRPMLALNAGVSGDTSAGALKRLPSWLKRKPLAAVVALGINDIVRGVDPTAIEQNLREILTRLRAAGARTLLCGMRIPPILGSSHAERFARLYPDLARELAIPIVPFLLEGVMGRVELNLADRIHPNAAGQKVIARHLLGPVARLLSR
ncbi:MAG: arylesterase [Thermoanaerobaculia bacterium]